MESKMLEEIIAGLCLRLVISLIISAIIKKPTLVVPHYGVSLAAIAYYVYYLDNTMSPEILGFISIDFIKPIIIKLAEKDTKYKKKKKART
jgi:hypothetical protein